MANGMRVGGRSLGRWVALIVIPAAFAVSVWSATGGSGLLSIGKLQPATGASRGALVPRGPGIPSIALIKTVGTDPSVCATTKLITLVGPGNTTVTYCYTVTNTGTVTFTIHDLVDTQLGQLLNDFPYPLPPSASAFLTASRGINVTTVNTATWTAFTSLPATAPGVAPGTPGQASASDTATVVVNSPTPTSTPTNTATITPTSTPTATPTGQPSIEVPSAPEIPALSSVGIALLALLLGAIAALHLRRR